MVSFIDDQRREYGVEPICAVLPIAPSTYYAHKAAERDPELRSVRVKRDHGLMEEIRRVWTRVISCTVRWSVRLRCVNWTSRGRHAEKGKANGGGPGVRSLAAPCRRPLRSVSVGASW
jgi:hypothetical protein